MKVEILREFNREDLADLRNLMRELNDEFSGEINEKILREIVNSPHHEIFVARELDEKFAEKIEKIDEKSPRNSAENSGNSRIVGCAILTEILDLVDGRIAYLSDFVVSEKIRASGVGSKIWDEMMKFCVVHDVKILEFTSNKSRKAAHEFYLKKDCEIYDTTVFKKKML